ncbi:MAG: 50S ribosomal protein L15 [Chloroflexi bacterium]|nr:50S ribosomal protein L15 [Chloroflexota bacterium]
MQLHQVSRPAGARHRRRRVGRGNAAGQGTTAGKGTKGQKARAGTSIPARFEGGQLPLVKRLPFKRGFVNHFRVDYVEVNLERLAAFAPGSQVTPESLQQAGIIKSTRQPVKILGRGSLETSLQVKAHKFTRSAQSKIEAAGGSVEVA